MPRLLRPHIPLKVRCRVILRQLGTIWPDDAIKDHGRSLRAFLDQFAFLLGCERADLRLDHDPALALRDKVFTHGEHVGYKPDANDPDHLRYRPHGAQFDNSHDVKTRIRGENGQYSDIQLIKRKRRREKRAAGKAKPRRKMVVPPNWKWPSRPLRSRNKFRNG